MHTIGVALRWGLFLVLSLSILLVGQIIKWGSWGLLQVLGTLGMYTIRLDRWLARRTRTEVPGEFDDLVDPVSNNQWKPITPIRGKAHVH